MFRRRSKKPEQVPDKPGSPSKDVHPAQKPAKSWKEKIAELTKDDPNIYPLF
jgi:hypothetical protein